MLLIKRHYSSVLALVYATDIIIGVHTHTYGYSVVECVAPFEPPWGMVIVGAAALNGYLI